MRSDGLRVMKRTGGGADHQQDHDLLDACGAFLHDRVRRRRVRGACESLIDASAFYFLGVGVSVICFHPAFSVPRCAANRHSGVVGDGWRVFAYLEGWVDGRNGRDEKYGWDGSIGVC